MADAEVTVKELIDYMTDFVNQRDWEQFHSPKNLAIGLVIETGELLEHFQWISEEQSRKVVEDPAAFAEVRDEIADVLCYLLCLADSLGFDLSDAFYEKMKRTVAKYPAEKYRGKYKLE
jgi:NTP pyrophosphatase (non-canonical NTP hydrolase)